MPSTNISRAFILFIKIRTQRKSLANFLFNMSTSDFATNDFINNDAIFFTFHAHDQFSENKNLLIRFRKFGRS